jgi:hypothetical protein
MQVLKYEVSKKLSIGLFHHDTITFVNRTQAHKWKAGIVRNIKAGKLTYELIGFRFIGSETI